MVKNDILGVGVTNQKKREILEYLCEKVQQKDTKLYVVTPNPEILVYATKHPAFKNILNNAGLALCDGVGLVWAGKVLGRPFIERFTGVDCMEMICKEVSCLNQKYPKKPITVGFLGGRNDVAQRTADCLQKRYQGLKIAWVGEEWPEKQLASSNQSLVKNTGEKLEASSYKLDAYIDILFVAFGFPKQEEFMSSHINKFPIQVMMGVGGAFDYISGSILRAPGFLRFLGLEWLYRLTTQPWRWKRQLALLTFIALVLQKRLKKSS